MTNQKTPPPPLEVVDLTDLNIKTPEINDDALVEILEQVSAGDPNKAPPFGSTWAGIIAQLVGNVAQARRLLRLTQEKHREALEAVTAKAREAQFARGTAERLKELAQSLDRQLTDEREAIRTALVEALVKAVANPDELEVNLVVNVNHASTLIVDRDDDDDEGTDGQA